MTNPNLDYLDEDLAYFLGLLVARGKISHSGGVHTIVIQFPFKNLEVEGIKKSYTQRNEFALGLNKSIRRIRELTEADVDPSDSEHSVVLTIKSTRNSIFFRDVNLLMQGKREHYEFHIPAQIYQADNQIKKEFLRGYADVGATARQSNKDQGGRHRVYFDILNPNWRLPIELCHLLQDHLQVPVQTIDYGHPNTRDSHGTEYKAGRKEAWAREHQLKVYCDAFCKVGFYMKHKQDILTELADYNETHFSEARFCTPPRNTSARFRHPGEKSAKLPREIRGKHYEGYWQICGDLGCPRQPKCLDIFKPFMPSVQQALGRKDL